MVLWTMFFRRMQTSNLTLIATLLLSLLRSGRSYHLGPFGYTPFKRKSYSYRRSNRFFSVPNDVDADSVIDHATLSVDDAWEDHFYTSQSAELGFADDERRYRTPSHSYVSHLVRDMSDKELDAFLSEQDQEQKQPSKTNNNGHQSQTQTQQNNQKKQSTPDTYIDEPYRHLRLLRRRLPDPLWSQIRLEAECALALEPDAGPQLYQHVLRQPSLMDALASIISHEIETELVPATALQALVLDQLRLSDDKNIHLDVAASANRNPSEDASALNALLFHRGLHALVCYRVSHRLWQAGRTGLAYYMQSTVSSRYAADIHPACKMEGGIFLSVGGGVVIGETARIGQDVTILQGVTLGGTGKEVGDRHPKVEDGVILHCGATVLGNLRVGKGAVITAKSIVTKEVPDLARVSGVPAKVKSFRELREEGFGDDVEDSHDGEEECDLDCKMRLLFEKYLVDLEALAEMELCIDSGSRNCWDTMSELLNS